MDEKTKLIIGLLQVENLIKLAKSNKWEFFLLHHLHSIKYELERQLTNINHSSKITE
tara:strand:- start:549 stop:719 length:171 start_codon:yes stop_codon:yes gene_type:complete